MSRPLRDAIVRIPVGDTDVLYDLVFAVLDEIDCWGPSSAARAGSIRQVMADALGGYMTAGEAGPGQSGDPA